MFFPIAMSLTLSSLPSSSSLASDELAPPQKTSLAIECQLQLSQVGSLNISTVQNIVNELAIKRPLLFGEAYLKIMVEKFTERRNSIKRLKPDLDHEQLKILAVEFWEAYSKAIESWGNKGSSHLVEFLGMKGPTEALVLRTIVLNINTAPENTPSGKLRNSIIDLIAHTFPKYTEIIQLQLHLNPIYWRRGKREEYRIQIEETTKDLIRKIMRGEMTFEKKEIVTVHTTEMTAFDLKYLSQREKIAKASFDFNSFAPIIALIGDKIDQLEKAIRNQVQSVRFSLQGSSRELALTTTDQAQKYSTSALDQVMKILEDLNLLTSKFNSQSPQDKLNSISTLWLVRANQLSVILENLLIKLEDLKEQTLRISRSDLSPLAQQLELFDQQLSRREVEVQQKSLPPARPARDIGHTVDDP